MQSTIHPAEVLMLAPDAAAATMRSLDDANRYVLISGMMRLALDPKNSIHADVAPVLSAVFSELGAARLKLYAFSFVLHAVNSPPRSKPLQLRLARVREALTPKLLWDVFRMPMGEAGLGIKPTELTGEDRVDVAAQRAGTLNVDVRYEPLVKAARESGTLIVEEIV